jgi:lysozyme
MLIRTKIVTLFKNHKQSSIFIDINTGKRSIKLKQMELSSRGLGFIKKASSAATIAYAQSKGGLELIKGFEGVRLKAYRDTAGIWTIGWGSTRWANGTPVKKGDKLVNIDCADDLFDLTLQSYVDDVRSLVKVPLTQNQFDALVSFQYNTGGLEGSTLLKKLNGRDYQGAADQFMLWDKVTDPITRQKKPFEVLTERRTKEQKLFLTP